ncbi:MAG: hypothetical protein AAF571_07065 [Verrucomicrobiota bacterium]
MKSQITNLASKSATGRNTWFGTSATFRGKSITVTTSGLIRSEKMGSASYMPENEGECRILKSALSPAPKMDEVITLTDWKASYRILKVREHTVNPEYVLELKRA